MFWPAAEATGVAYCTRVQWLVYRAALKFLEN
jgi:hypothetical protein